MIKLGIYVAFFFMLLMFYGLPIHIIRDLFMTSRDFLKRLTALLRYRRAIQEMNRYPDATEEELAQENTCIICREEMRPWDPENTGAVDRTRPKKLPCGHTLHLGCLKSWLERQQVCPTCRSPVTVDRARAFPNRRIGLRIQVGGNGQQGAAQQGANPPDPGAADGQQQQQPQQAPGPHDNQQPENRPRIFNLGPLRLGFGANGAQVRELARQFGAQPGAGNVGAAPAVPAAPSPGTTAQPPSSSDNLQNAAHLLQQAEQAFQREMSALDLRLRELQTCDLLLAELQRIRQRHALLDQTTAVNTLPGSSPNLSFPASLSPNTGGVFPHQVPSFPSVPARINSPLLGRHGTTSYTTEIPAGSPDLPDGVVIPPGWSLMPLQRLSGIQPPRQPSPHPGPAPPSVPSTEPESGASPAGDAHGRSVRPTEASSDAHTSRSIPLVHTSRTTADTPVVSPSPVLPNWGGPAQLFGTSARLDATSAMESQLEPAAQAAGEPAAADQSSQDTQPAAEEDGKGKGRAVTVEDVPEADHDEGEDDSGDE